jgi:hypothetical protein
LHGRGQEELLALDALQVAAVADVLPEPDEGERLRPVDLLPPRREVEVGRAVVDGERQADVDPVHVVDDGLEAVEADLDEVVDVDVGGLLQGPPQAGGAAVGERRVERLQLAGRRRLPGVALLVGRAVVDRHHGVAGETDHVGVRVVGRDVQQHRRVRARPQDIPAELAVGAGPGVRADHQDVG